VAPICQICQAAFPKWSGVENHWREVHGVAGTSGVSGVQVRTPMLTKIFK
jgi:hypothetical protein